MNNKKRICISIAMIIIFALSYYFIRYTFYDLHGMKQQTTFLSAVGGLVLVIAITKM